MKKPRYPEKMDLYEYEEKYVSHANYKSASGWIYLIVTALGLLIISALIDLALKAYQLNEYAGYATGVVALILFIVFYVAPTCKLLSQKAFRVDITRKNAAEAKKHNKRLRHEIAKRFIDYNETVENGSWYSSEKLDAVEVALLAKNEPALITALGNIFSTDVEKTSKEIIYKTALRSGIYSAVSQTALVDTSLVIVVNLQMIKDIIFLYGFRPTYPELLRIYRKVLVSALVAYGLGSVNIGKGASQLFSGAIKSIPLLGSAISTAIDSTVQGLTNAALSVVIGFHTIKILTKQYNLQRIVDGIDLDEIENDLKQSYSTLKEELANEKKAQKTTKP